jgi:hypothetical protein
MKVPKKAKRPKQPELPDLPESNPFVDGLVEWMDSPEGQLSIEAMDLVFALLENVQVDANARQLIWTDGERLSIDASVKRIHAQHPELPAELIEDKLISWLEMDYEPEGASQQQLDELDQLTEKWIDDHNRAHRRAR